MGRPDRFGKIEPEGELVQSKGGAYPEQERSDASGPDGTVPGAGANLGQPEIADDQQEQDTPNQVVDMTSATRDDVMERAMPARME